MEQPSQLTMTIAIVPVVAVVIGLLAGFVALGARFVLTGLVVGDHAEIMVRELQVVFRLNPVAIVLRVLSQLLVLVEQLRCVATRPAVDPVELVSATAQIAIYATAATIVAIVIQGKSSIHAACAAEPSAENVQRAMASGSLGAPNLFAPHHESRLTPHLA